MSRPDRTVLPPPPTALACLRHAARSLASQALVLAALAFGLAALAAVVALHAATAAPARLLAAAGLTLFVLVPLRQGVRHAALRAVRGEPVRASDVLRALDNYREVVAAQALVWIGVALGLACFGLPGVWLHARTRLVPYLVVDEEMDAAEAIAESVRRTRGRCRTALALSLIGAGLAGAGLLTLGAGLVPAWLLGETAFAALHHALAAEPRPLVPAAAPARLAAAHAGRWRPAQLGLRQRSE